MNNDFKVSVKCIRDPGSKKGANLWNEYSADIATIRGMKERGLDPRQKFGERMHQSKRSQLSLHLIDELLNWQQNEMEKRE